MTQRLREVYRAGIRAAFLGLLANLLLGIVKLIGGIVGQSFALIADAINSLGDSAASVIVLASLRIAQKPADSDHPYGHSRAEAVGASTVSILIILAALFVGWQAATRLTLVHGVPAAWTLWIAGGNAVIKEALFRYSMGVGRRIGSTAIIANAWDHRSDAFCSLAALVGIAVVRWKGEQHMWADEAAALVIVFAILWAGLRLYVYSASELLDPQANPAFVARIRSVAENVEGVRGVEKLWVRTAGLEYFVDIHIEVDGAMTVNAGHELGHDVKNILLRNFPRLRGILVHLEPHREDVGPSDS